MISLKYLKFENDQFEISRFWKLMQGESKKSVISGVWCKVVLFCANLLYGVFSIFFRKLKKKFGTPMAQKKSSNLFFLKSKVPKSKNVCINYFNRNLKFDIDWIAESQKIRIIAIRKFIIFSYSLIFKEKLFFNDSSGFNRTA